MKLSNIKGAKTLSKENLQHINGGSYEYFQCRHLDFQGVSPLPEFCDKFNF